MSEYEHLLDKAFALLNASKEEKIYYIETFA